MQVRYRAEGETEWQTMQVGVDGSGSGQHDVQGASKTFECYFVAGRIESDRVTVTVTERPLIVNLKAETEFPAYAKRAPVIEPRSDGNLRDKLYGSSVFLTIEANKRLASVTLTRSYGSEPDSLVVGAQYAKGVIRLDHAKWLADDAQSMTEHYTLKITDEYGFSNEDFDHRYELVVVKDQAPTLAIVSLPHRSPGDEVPILEERVGGYGVAVRAKDDYGIASVKVYYRVESLDDNTEKSSDSRARVFPLPQADIQQLNLMRLSETGAKVGDRIIVWAEAEDAYDLEPAKGPHKVKTPLYRIAVVTKEEMFENLVNRDTFHIDWYDNIKLAALPGREVPRRTSPEAEPASNVAAKLLNAPQMGEGINAADQQLIQDYFNSLNVK
jgi:hypothetical protein